jgi:rhamnogalacturonyl hydrolase YesR
MHPCRLLAAAVVLVALAKASPGVEASLTPAAVKTIMTRVADWQLAHFSTQTLNRAEADKPEAVPEDGWIRATGYAGILAAHRTTGDAKYLDATLAWAERNRWQSGPRPRHADDQCVAQAYAELSFLQPDPRKLAGIRRNFDLMIAEPFWGPVAGWSKSNNWSWCDALFMAPPAMVRVAQATGDARYLDLMNRMWWETHAYLYDPAEQLFFRDANYFIKPDGSGPRTPSGRKIFWGRGNGWVLAGLARTLQYLPGDFRDRPRYVALFRAMADRIAGLQQADGLWRSSLNEPSWYPTKEASCSGMFCFAFAWGVNAGLLDAGRFRPAAERAWQGLVGCVDADGKLGWVQLTGHDPRPVYAGDTLDYGPGAFLLAGEQIVALLDRSSAQ